MVWFNVKTETFRFYLLCTTNFYECICMQMHRRDHIEISGERKKEWQKERKTHKRNKRNGETNQRTGSKKKNEHIEISVKVQCAFGQWQKNGYMHRLIQNSCSVALKCSCITSKENEWELKRMHFSIHCVWIWNFSSMFSFQEIRNKQ